MIVDILIDRKVFALFVGLSPWVLLNYRDVASTVLYLFYTSVDVSLKNENPSSGIMSSSVVCRMKSPK